MWDPHLSPLISKVVCWNKEVIISVSKKIFSYTLPLHSFFPNPSNITTSYTLSLSKIV
ncbi:hypothetical protein HanPSC8_Chr02g0075951 [Helianthus annuus]|nr:hypothetical protein HanPSC8_Chr02g0075951 [Helianthus annuus]